jgi:hypothetical protein
MRSAIISLALCASSTYAAALPVSQRDTPLSFDTKPSQTPVAVTYDWTSGYVSEFPIHSSCNASERLELRQGLNEAVILAQHAKEHSKFLSHYPDSSF